jgi:predicted dithiol-disulfide oxidoreductase (DUF899 family)
MESPITRTRLQTDDHREARQSLLQAEIALKDQREAVVEMRRDLPPNPVTDDYLFMEGPRDLAEEGPVRPVRLSELFTADDRTLIVYHFMYSPDMESPCPMCSMWADGFNGIAHHLEDRVDFALVASSGISRFRDLARKPGWNGVRLLSSSESSFNFDLGFEDSDGGQWPGVSVFTKTAEGEVLHRYSVSAILGGEHFRGVDSLTPVWNLLDLTPEGRGDWMPDLGVLGNPEPVTTA